jgi:hypothetical protein
VFQVHHDDTTLRGFTIDGKVCADLVEACYRDKGIYVVSTVAHDGVSGTKITGMRLTNLGGECIRIKYFATPSAVEGNQIGPCGVHDFAVPNTTTGQNGEGVYIGTAPEQLGNNPSPEPDLSNDNRVARNVIDTRGAECVDIKESARDNVVEFNTCTGQQPRNGNSGAMESRGPSNTFRVQPHPPQRGGRHPHRRRPPGRRGGQRHPQQRDHPQRPRWHQGPGVRAAREDLRQRDVRERRRERGRHLPRPDRRPDRDLPAPVVCARLLRCG